MGKLRLRGQGTNRSDGGGLKDNSSHQHDYGAHAAWRVLRHALSGSDSLHPAPGSYAYTHFPEEETDSVKEDVAFAGPHSCTRDSLLHF